MFYVRLCDITSWKYHLQDIIVPIRLQDWFGKKARNFLWIIFVTKWDLSSRITKQTPMQRLVQGFCCMKQSNSALRHLSSLNENWKSAPRSCKTRKQRFALSTPCFNLLKQRFVLLKQRNNLLILCFIFMKSRKNFPEFKYCKNQTDRSEFDTLNYKKKDAVLRFRFIERGGSNKQIGLRKGLKKWQVWKATISKAYGKVYCRECFLSHENCSNTNQLP